MAVKLHRSNTAAALSLTPLIDVVFLLLIFFLVTSEFEEEERSLDIELPTATTATPMVGKTRSIIVDVDERGEVFLSGRAIGVAQLQEELKRAVAENPAGQSVIIRADHRSSFQPVVSVMDVCNRVGVRDYSVTTRDPPSVRS